MISELNGGRNLTLILDHHVAEASTDPMVHNLDPDLFGLKATGISPDRRPVIYSQ